MTFKKRFSFLTLLSLFVGISFLPSFLSANSFGEARASAHSGSINTDFSTISGSGSYNYITTSDIADLYDVNGVSSGANSEHGLLPSTWEDPASISSSAYLVYQISLDSGMQFTSLTFNMNAVLTNMGDEYMHEHNYYDIFVGTDASNIMNGNPTSRICLKEKTEDYETQIASQNGFRDMPSINLTSAASGKNSLYLALVIHAADDCDSSNKATYMSGDKFYMLFMGTKIKTINISYNYDDGGVTPEPSIQGNEINTTDYQYYFKGKDAGDYSWAKDTYSYDNVILKSDTDEGNGLTIDSLQGTGEGKTGSIVYRMTAPSSYTYNTLSINATARIANYFGGDANIKFYVSTDGNEYTLIKTFNKNNDDPDISLSFPTSGDTPILYEEGVEDIFVKIELYGYAELDHVVLKEVGIKVNYTSEPPTTLENDRSKYKGTGDLLLQIDYKDRELIDVKIDDVSIDDALYYPDVNTLVIKEECINSLETGAHSIEAFTSGGSVKYAIKISELPAPNKINEASIIIIIVIVSSTTLVGSILVGIYAKHRVKIKLK